MIYTLTTSLALYEVNRNRGAMMLRHEKRKALCRLCLITLCLTSATLIWIIYG
jgi:hypothetical protein